MTGTMHASLAMCLFLSGLLPTFQAEGAGISVLREGFCVKKGATGCADVVLPDTLIDINKLPKDPGGNTVIYFYSVQKTDINTILVHVLEAEEGKAQVAYEKLQGDDPQSEALKPQLDALIKKLAPEGSIVVTPFHVDPSPGATAPLISAIPVTGPGALHASVVDLLGNPIPASARISINVVQSAH